MTTNSTARQVNYLKRMYAMGFQRHTLFIHEKDQDLLALVQKRMEERKAEHKKAEQAEEAEWM